MSVSNDALHKSVYQDIRNSVIVTDIGTHVKIIYKYKLTFFATKTCQVKHDVHGCFILPNDLAPDVHMHCHHLWRQVVHSALVIPELSAISAHGKGFGLAGSSFQVSNVLGLSPHEALLLWQASCRMSISVSAKIPAWNLQQQAVQGSCCKICRLQWVYSFEAECLLRTDALSRTESDKQLCPGFAVAGMPDLQPGRHFQPKITEGDRLQVLDKLRDVSQQRPLFAELLERADSEDKSKLIDSVKPHL